ncbi:hypothetical protein IW262DRAFT_925558 [Armillaria fumosa]|nr:hypothetical protein IW262DRAFT_925558 [Armillaria fumosa]
MATFSWNLFCILISRTVSLAGTRSHNSYPKFKGGKLNHKETYSPKSAVALIADFSGTEVVGEDDDSSDRDVSVAQAALEPIRLLNDTVLRGSSLPGHVIIYWVNGHFLNGTPIIQLVQLTGQGGHFEYLYPVAESRNVFTIAGYTNHFSLDEFTARTRQLRSMLLRWSTSVVFG